MQGGHINNGRGGGRRLIPNSMYFPTSKNGCCNCLRQGPSATVQLGNAFQMNTKVFALLTFTTLHATCMGDIVTLALSVSIRSPSTALDVAGGHKYGSQGSYRIPHPPQTAQTTDNKSCASAHHYHIHHVCT
jgi:hypothetical protein